MAQQGTVSQHMQWIYAWPLITGHTFGSCGNGNIKQEIRLNIRVREWLLRPRTNEACPRVPTSTTANWFYYAFWQSNCHELHVGLRNQSQQPALCSTSGSYIINRNTWEQRKLSNALEWSIQVIPPAAFWRIRNQHGFGGTCFKSAVHVLGKGWQITKNTASMSHSAAVPGINGLNFYVHETSVRNAARLPNFKSNWQLWKHTSPHE